MGIKEKLSAGLKAIQEETQKQFEKTKEAINNYKPHQLEKKMKINWLTKMIYLGKIILWLNLGIPRGPRSFFYIKGINSYEGV